MADDSVIVNKQGTIFLTGRLPLVKAATGEIVTDEGTRRRGCSLP
nr:hypothetical protein [Vibrio neptunius]